MEHAKNNRHNVVLLDTAGRLHIDEGYDGGTGRIKGAVEMDATVLVVGRHDGQDAVNVAQMFNDKIGIDGVILTKWMAIHGAERRFRLKRSAENRFCYVGMEKSFRIWNSFIRTVWHPESLVWEM